MSRALRRALRPGGGLAFQVIHAATGLPDRDRRRAYRSGPWAVASRFPPAELVRRAGFVHVDVVDQTKEFRATAAAWIEEWDRSRDPLVALLGEAEFTMRQRERRAQLAAIDDGLLQRSLVTGRRPVAATRATRV